VLDDVADAASANPWLHVEFTERGGHAGFVSGSPWRPAYYLEKRIVDFLSGTVGSAQPDSGPGTPELAPEAGPGRR
jgi:predicted alpha/beta-fold hydrolase